MKVQQVANFFGKSTNYAQNQNQSDLTSFGAQPKAAANNTQLISNSAAEALKNKYMSNISFTGHTETLKVKASDDEYRETGRYVGTDGEVSEYDSYCATKELEKVKDAETFAKIDSGSAVHMSGKHAQEAALEAIRNSASCGVCDAIKEVDPVGSYGGTTQVYFTDPGETVYKSDRAGKGYVVYAPGAKDADERPFWKRIFG